MLRLEVPGEDEKKKKVLPRSNTTTFHIHYTSTSFEHREKKTYKMYVAMSYKQDRLDEMIFVNKSGKVLYIKR